MKPFSGSCLSALDQDQGPVQVPALVGQGVAHVVQGVGVVRVLADDLLQ